MAGEIHPRTLIARRALLGLADNGRTDAGPMPGLLARAARIEEPPDVLAISINAGFPYADVHHAGPTVLVTGDGDNLRLRDIAEELMGDVWVTRDICTNTYLGVDEAAATAKSHEGGGQPLIIADYSDNPGGGAYGDATDLLRAMVDAGLSTPSSKLPASTACSMFSAMRASSSAMGNARSRFRKRGIGGSSSFRLPS